MCYILCFAWLELGGHRGVRAPYMGVGGNAPWAVFCIHFWAVFRHMVFADGFLFPVKELGLLTNPGYWIRVLDAMDPICILYCKQCMM
jgi:hypothetical protein